MGSINMDGGGSHRAPPLTEVVIVYGMGKGMVLVIQLVVIAPASNYSLTSL